MASLASSQIATPSRRALAHASSPPPQLFPNFRRKTTEADRFTLQLAGGTSAGEVQLPTYYEALLAAHGPQHWWLGRSRFEIIVGAILVQNTSWTNVEHAIANLRRAKVLSPKAILELPSRQLATLIRPSGYFRQKTKTLKAFVNFLYDWPHPALRRLCSPLSSHSVPLLRGGYRGSLTRLFAAPTKQLREQLLALRGIGPETADSILLYAGKHPVFVADAYTRRIFERHHLIPAGAGYEEIRSAFEAALPRDHQLLNEFHALIVRTAKHFCAKSKPSCEDCSLRPFLPEPASARIEIATQSPAVASRRSSLSTLHSPLATSP